MRTLLGSTSLHALRFGDGTWRGVLFPRLLLRQIHQPERVILAASKRTMTTIGRNDRYEARLVTPPQFYALLDATERKLKRAGYGDASRTNTEEQAQVWIRSPAPNDKEASLLETVDKSNIVVEIFLGSENAVGTYSPADFRNRRVLELLVPLQYGCTFRCTHRALQAYGPILEPQFRRARTQECICKTIYDIATQHPDDLFLIALKHFDWDPNGQSGFALILDCLPALPADHPARVQSFMCRRL